MTDAELEDLIKDLSGQMEQLPDDSTKPLNKEERRMKALLRARCEALTRAKSAMEKGITRQEVKALADYALLTEYGDKNWIWFNLMKSRMMFLGF